MFRILQELTVPDGKPIMRAIGRIPPNTLNIIFSTGLMGEMYPFWLQTVNINVAIKNTDMNTKITQYDEMSRVGLKLKVLRERTGLSVRKFAELADMNFGTYSNWENRSKKQYLNMEVVEQLREVYLTHGVEEKDILALAGLTTSNENSSVVELGGFNHPSQRRPIAGAVDQSLLTEILTVALDYKQSLEVSEKRSIPNDSFSHVISTLYGEFQGGVLSTSEIEKSTALLLNFAAKK